MSQGEDNPIYLQAAIYYIMSRMAMTKYADAEGAKVLTTKEHDEIESGLHRLGKTSARDLTDEQRAKVLPQGVQGQPSNC